MRTKLTIACRVVAAAASLLVMPASAVDLLARYPTQLSAGDPQPDHARAWDFNQEDIFRVAKFVLQVGDKLKVEINSADLGVGHCADGAVWAVLLPRGQGTLTSPVADHGEPVANVWLRFHPAQINRLFPPETVFADGDTNLISQIQSVVNAKFRSSWHAGMNAMIPEPKDVTVYVDTKGGAHRFFMVDTQAETAEYVAAFNQQKSSSPKITPNAVPPVVVKTVPEAGSRDVRPGECEIKVTFSKQMSDGSWSWCTVWDDSNPEALGKPKYDADHQTCVMKVTLEPGTTYGYWLNSERFHGFQDTEGHSAVPYLLAFTTKGKAPSYLEHQLKQAQAGNYWAKFNLWDGYAHGAHDIATNAAGAEHWLGELAKGAYLAKFEPAGGFSPITAKELLDEFDDHCQLHSAPGSLGGASFFRTVNQDGKLVGSFLTDTPDAFRAAVERNPNLKLISIEPVTPESFLAHEASKQESLTPPTQSTNTPPKPAGAAEADTNRPGVVSVFPPDGATNLDCQQDIRIRFNQPMRPGSMELQWRSGGFSSGGDARYEADKNEFVIPVRLLPGQTNDLCLNVFNRGGFRSVAGPAASEFHWQFSTRPVVAKSDAPKPKLVEISPSAAGPLPVLTMLQLTFDQPMRPPDEGFPYLEKSPFLDVPGVIGQFRYDAAARRFTVPVVLPPDNPVKLTLTGFYSAAGVPADPVVVRREVGTNDYSPEQTQAIAAAAQNPQLKQLLTAMKDARQRLTSGVETVQWKLLNGGPASTSLRVNQAIFKWQGTNQALGDISDIMDTKAFVLGNDGTNCWLFSDGNEGQSLQTCPVKFMADLNVSIADPFALASRPVDTVIAEDKLSYAGQAQLAGRTCHRLQSWTVFQAHEQYDRTSADCSEWWIDAATCLPVQLIHSSTYGCQIYAFDFDHLNQPLPDNTFAPPAVTRLDPKAEQYKLFRREIPAPDEKRFMTIRDGGDGSMSGRLGRNDSSGRTSSGLN
jgi:hypothetical protein